MATVKAPQRGPGRPRKPQAPRTDAQALLAAAIEAVSLERDQAAAAYRVNPTVAAELALLSARMSVAAEWEAYLQSTGDHSHALKYGDAATQLAKGITSLRALTMQDKMDQLEMKNTREEEIGSMVATEMTADDDYEETAL